MLGYPFLGDHLGAQRAAQLQLALVAVMFDLTDLFDHTRAKQGVLVDKGDTDQIVLLLLAAPGHHAGITGILAKPRDAQFHRSTPSKSPFGIACHTTETDIVQALLWHGGLLAHNQLNRHITGMTQKMTHLKQPLMPSN